MSPEQALQNLNNLANMPDVRLNMIDNTAVRESLQTMSGFIEKANDDSLALREALKQVQKLTGGKYKE